MTSALQPATCTFSARLMRAADDRSFAETSEVLAAIDRLSQPEAITTSGLVSAQGLEVEVAASSAQRRIAWRMVHEEYRRKGYASGSGPGEWRDLFDALPGTCTFLARQEDGPVATMTVFPDAPAGLPADALYREELDALRAEGRRLCEFGRLAHRLDDADSSPATALALFRYGFLHACHRQPSDDLLLTVNPRHVAFYTRRLACTVLGPERSLAKVTGAPAVLLRLDLHRAEPRYRALYGTAPDGLWHFFADPNRIAPHMRRLFLQTRPLDPLVVEALFGDEARTAAARGDRLGQAVLAAWPDLRQPLAV